MWPYIVVQAIKMLVVKQASKFVCTSGFIIISFSEFLKTNKTLAFCTIISLIINKQKKQFQQDVTFILMELVDANFKAAINCLIG